MKNSNSEELLKTPLHSLHLELNARMVSFAGYEMPIQYPSGIRKEHEHTRSSASLFDISHMGQVRITGEDVPGELERLIPGDISRLGENRQQYCVFTNTNGGILDDLMITRMPNSFFLVVNAACKEKDFKYLQDNIGNTCEIDWVDAALMALQGPLASQILKKYSLELASMPFLSAIQTEIDGISCLVHRCGYTGEDGYEISVSNTQAEQLARILLQDDAIEPAGLGARDSLRLEAGLCLYGHDLDETTSPIEADLSWIIAKKYRVGDGIKAFFPGADIILEQLQNGPARIRRGFIPNSRIPVREGTTIINSSGEKIGIITSGGYGQSIGKPVCIGYLDINADNVDDYQVVIRDKTISLARINLPFVNHRYYK